MSHLRYEHDIAPGGKKQLTGPYARLIAVDGGNEIDISACVTKSSIRLDPGHAATLELTILGFELTAAPLPPPTELPPARNPGRRTT